jgi:hypothetical protein
LLRVFEAGDIAHDAAFVDVQAFAHQDADAVIGLLAREPAPVAFRFEFGAGEFVVGQFQFLQAQHIRVAGFEPVDDVLQATLRELTFQVAIFMAFSHSCWARLSGALTPRFCVIPLPRQPVWLPGSGLPGPA